MRIIFKILSAFIGKNKRDPPPRKGRGMKVAELFLVLILYSEREKIGVNHCWNLSQAVSASSFPASPAPLLPMSGPSSIFRGDVRPLQQSPDGHGSVSDASCPPPAHLGQWKSGSDLCMLAISDNALYFPNIYKIRRKSGRRHNHILLQTKMQSIDFPQKE